MHQLTRILLSLPLMFCSCTVQTYRYFADKALEGESIYIPRESEQSGGLLLYRAGNKTYVRGIRSRTMLKSSGYLKDHSPFSEIHIRERHFPVHEVAQQNVYREIKSRRHPNGARRWEKTDSPWLDTLPDNARPFRSSDTILSSYNGYMAGAVDAEETRPMRTTAKALYYYPLAAVTFTAVDVPLTLAGNTVLLCGGAVFLAAAGCESLAYGAYSVGKMCVDAFSSEDVSTPPASGENELPPQKQQAEH